MTDCPHPKSAKAKRCRSCSAKHMNSRPDAKEKRLAGMAAYYSRPENLAKAQERTRKLNDRLMQDPAHVEKLRQNGMRLVREVLTQPEIRARIYSPEVCARRGKAIAAAKLAHIPEQYREEYKALVRGGNVNAAEAREIIMRQAARDNDPIKILNRYYGGRPARAA